MLICASCHAGCCRRFSVHLTGYDLIKLSKTLSMDYLQIAQIHPISAEEAEKIAKHTALFLFPSLRDGFFTFYLRHVKSTYMPGSHKCMFLQEWSNADFLLPDPAKITVRCGTYSIRPLTCSIFPSRLNDDGLIGLTGTPGVNLTPPEHPAYELCPRPLTETDNVDYSGETMRNLVLYKYEMDYFKSFAQAWNNKPGNFENFFECMENAYKNRILFMDNYKEPENELE